MRLKVPTLGREIQGYLVCGVCDGCVNSCEVSSRSNVCFEDRTEFTNLYRRQVENDGALTSVETREIRSEGVARRGQITTSLELAIKTFSSTHPKRVSYMLVQESDIDPDRSRDAANIAALLPRSVEIVQLRYDSVYGLLGDML